MKIQNCFKRLYRYLADWYTRPLRNCEERLKQSISTAEKRVSDVIGRSAINKGGLIQAVYDNSYLQYYQLHQIYLERLRKKASSGQTIIVFFLVSYCDKFGSKSVYEAMSNSPVFNPYIYIVHPRDRWFEEHPEYLAEAEENYHQFCNKGYQTIFGYDAESGRPKLFDDLSPDIVFYNNPNLWMFSHYNNIYLNANYLTCYMAYFMDCTDLSEPFRYYYRCNYPASNTAWKIFEESYFSYYGVTETLSLEKNPKVSLWSGTNAVLSGYPKLDDYTKDDLEINLPSRLNNGKPIIIYAPHWSIRYLMKLSTFHLFGIKMLEFAKEHNEYNFVYKPHPELIDHIRDINGKGVRNLSSIRGDFKMTVEEYESYVEEFDSLPNGLVFKGGDYIELFKKSSLLITDCGSFIQEYLPSGHPVIYILNPEKKNPMDFYGELGKKVLNSYYCCKCWEEIINWIDNTLVKRIDPKLNERMKVLSEEFVNVGKSGKFVCDYIEKQLLN